MASVAVAKRAPGPTLRPRRWWSGFRERETRVAYLFLLPWIIRYKQLWDDPKVAALLKNTIIHMVMIVRGTRPVSAAVS